jgi:hypothetical protein
MKKYMSISVKELERKILLARPTFVWSDNAKKASRKQSIWVWVRFMTSSGGAICVSQVLCPHKEGNKWRSDRLSPAPLQVRLTLNWPDPRPLEGCNIRSDIHANEELLGVRRDVRGRRTCTSCCMVFPSVDTGRDNIHSSGQQETLKRQGWTRWGLLSGYLTLVCIEAYVC